MTTTDTNITDDPNHISEQDRRACLEHVALDGLQATADKIGIDADEMLDYALRAICLELCSVSIRYEGETVPAVQALGQWVGGMLGTGTVATDEVGLTMHQRGGELRDHITRKIGWPQQMAVSTTD